MTSEDIAWFTGLFEGEGSVHIDKNGGDAKSRGCGCLVIAMTDKDTIEKVRKTTGVGAVQGPYKPNTSYGGKKQIWRWRVRGSDAVQTLIELMLPRLSLRRTQQAKEVLDYLETGRDNRYAFGTRGAQVKCGLQ